MNSKSGLTIICEFITLLARGEDCFSADDVRGCLETAGFCDIPSNQIGQAFRICAKSGVIVKVRPVQSQGEGRNGSLVWLWKRV